jgi:hypothetical protein
MQRLTVYFQLTEHQHMVFLDLHHKPWALTRMASLLDDEDDDEVKIAPMVIDVPASGIGPSLLKDDDVGVVGVLYASPPREIDVLPVQPSVATDQEKGGLPAGLGQGEVPQGFNELGTILLPCRIPFQGSYIGPYLHYPFDIDIARVMAELGKQVHLASSIAKASALAK